MLLAVICVNNLPSCAICASETKLPSYILWQHLNRIKTCLNLVWMSLALFKGMGSVSGLPQGLCHIESRCCAAAGIHLKFFSEM